MTGKEYRELFTKSYPNQMRSPTIIDICFDVRMSIVGASDPLSDEKLDEFLTIAKGKIDNWYERVDTIDLLAKLIIINCIELVENELGRRALLKTVE